MKTLIPLFLVALCASAQSVGRISGIVLDAGEAAVTSAAISIESTAGVRRATMSDGEGRFVLPDLPIGQYVLTAGAPGFAQYKRAVELNVGSTLSLTVRLDVTQVTESVEVRAETPVIEPQGVSGAVMTTKPLIDLPINGRDYGRFTLLTPGAVTRSSGLGDISFNGLHASHNNFTIDGVDASRVDQPFLSNGFERGGRLFSGSLDTIAEFRVQTSNYRAEHGRAAGSIITIATRGGTNQWRGALYHFFRNDALDARNFFNVASQPKAPFRYNNFGANFGGPVVKDKTFFFANYEGSRQRLGVTSSGTVPSALMRERTLAASPVLRPILEMYPPGQTPTSNALLDLYTTSRSQQVREDTGSIRIDHNLSSRDRIFGRFNRADTEVFGPLFSVLPTALGRDDFQRVPVTTANAAFNWQRTAGASLLFDFTAGLQRTATAGDSDLPLPATNVAGVQAAPGSRRRQRTNTALAQYGLSLTWTTGAHTWKFGGAAFHSQVNSLTTPVVNLTYLSIEDFINNRLGQASLSPGNPGSGLRQIHAGMYAQDTWRAARTLTLDYGLRYDVTTPNYDVNGEMRPFEVRTGGLAAPGAPFYSWNRRNFAPRSALAWQATEKTVIRTGYGIFYQQYPAGFGGTVPLNTVPGNTLLLRQQIPALSWPLDALVGQGRPQPQAVAGFDPNRPDTYSQQWNFTIQRELPGAVAFTAAYLGNRGVNLRRTANINFIDPATGQRPLPQFAGVSMEFNDGQSTWHGLQLSATRRFQSGLLVSAHYTWSKGIDDVQDYGAQLNTQIQDNRCRSCERALSSTDLRHNATFQVLYDLPFPRSGIARAAFGNWRLATLGILHSGTPVNVTMPVNTFGSDNLVNQRPDRVVGVPLYPENRSPALWFNPAAFRTPARGTYGNSGRNVLTGPSFVQVDASLIREVAVSERTRLQIRGEVFNVLNRPNFAPPNASFGTPNFGRVFNTFGRTIGSGTSRQIQLALRLTF